MNLERIKELEKFADTFYQKLNKDEKEFNIKPPMKKSYSTFGTTEPEKIKLIKKLSRTQTNILPSLTSPELPPIKINKKKQPKLKGDIYKTLLPWVPPNFVGRYFGKFNRLRDEHFMSTWEKVNK